MLIVRFKHKWKQKKEIRDVYYLISNSIEEARDVKQKFNNFQAKEANIKMKAIMNESTRNEERSSKRTLEKMQKNVVKQKTSQVKLIFDFVCFLIYSYNEDWLVILEGKIVAAMFNESKKNIFLMPEASFGEDKVFREFVRSSRN
jgi:U3 small nucleolar RNA-associated protein 14